MYKLQHVARELVANAAMGVPAIRRVRIQRGRTVGASIEQKAQAISEQFQFFLAIIGKERLRNAHIVEIGPGDVIPLAPLFIGSGARKYTAIDRFLGAVTSQEAVDLYNQVLQHATPDITETLETLGYWRGAQFDVKSFLQHPNTVTLIPQSIESMPTLSSNADWLISFNVCEHLQDLPLALTNMTKLLGTAGQMIHRIDYGPHDIWQTCDNPLTFLTVPDFLWTMMSTNRGCPNRYRHREVVEHLESLGLQVSPRIGTCATDNAVQEVAPFLPRRIRHLAAHDIAVLDAEILCSARADLSLDAAP